MFEQSSFSTRCAVAREPPGSEGALQRRYLAGAPGVGARHGVAWKGTGLALPALSIGLLVCMIVAPEGCCKALLMQQESVETRRPDNAPAYSLCRGAWQLARISGDESAERVDLSRCKQDLVD